MFCTNDAEGGEDPQLPSRRSQHAVPLPLPLLSPVLFPRPSSAPTMRMVAKTRSCHREGRSTLRPYACRRHQPFWVIDAVL